MSEAEHLYQPYRKHAALFGSTFLQEWLHSDILTLTRALTDSTVLSEIPRKLLRKETDQVYSCNCVSASFVTMFNEEIEHFYSISAEKKIPIKRPNSMNNYGVVVNTIGMRPLITSLQQNHVWPLAKYLFPKEGSHFDDHHSFLVRYQADEDLGLDMHIDDSDVTFNVCLKENFQGSTLSFCGNLGRPNHRKHVHTYHHELGRAVIHLGSRRHGANDIQSGSRTNLIVWNHNFAWRDSAEYSRQRTILYEREQGPPDEICLSYTHDRDYSFYKELPERSRGETFDGRWCPPEGLEYREYQSISVRHQAKATGSPEEKPSELE